MILTFIIAAIVSLEADFVQTKQVGLMSEAQVSSGHMTYRSPDYMRWEYTQPQPIVWEIDGDSTNVHPQVQKLLRMIMHSVANEGQVDAKTQKESKRLFESVQILMDEETHVARRVELVEKNGDTTIIEFTNVIAQ